EFDRYRQDEIAGLPEQGDRSAVVNGATVRLGRRQPRQQFVGDDGQVGNGTPHGLATIRSSHSRWASVIGDVTQSPFTGRIVKWPYIPSPLNVPPYTPPPCSGPYVPRTGNSTCWGPPVVGTVNLIVQAATPDGFMQLLGPSTP